MSRLAKTIISLLSVTVVAVAGILLYVFWPAITGTINNNKYYTADDVQESYDKGFDDGNKSQTELNAEIVYYKSLVDEYEAEVASLNKEINNLVALKNQNQVTINNLTSIKNENEATINTLQSTIKKNDESIENYQTKIEELNNQIRILQNSNTNYQTEISNLKSQVSNYQTIVNQLQNTNEMNIQTIKSLNNQSEILNKQISDLQFELNSNSGDVTKLKNTIKELEKSIAYYESYISALESETQVVATFEFDGSVYNIQIVNKGSNVSVVTPESSGKITFNYWTVDGERVDLNTYKMNSNTKFIANVTYKNEVVFKSDGEDVKLEYIENGKFATAPTVSKDGYEFDGWTIDGKNIVDVSTYEVTKDLTFVAVYTKIHTVTFVYENNVVSTQKVRDGEYAENIKIENTNYKLFNGWTTNGAIVDVSSYKISSSVVFTASITYSYDVRFIVDDAVYNSQIVTENNYVLVPTNPKKTSYIFNGWMLNNEIIDLTTYKITSNIDFVASFTYSPGGVFNDDGSLLLSWDEMVEQKYISLKTETSVAGGSNESRKTISGYLKIPDYITKIESAAFYDWGGITGVDVPLSVTYIGSNSFGKCISLKEMSLPFIGLSPYRNIQSHFGWLFATSSSTGTMAVTQKISDSTTKKYYIPTSIKKVILKQDAWGYGAFYGCGMLTDVVFDCEIKDIPPFAFYDCYGITSFIVPEGVTEIGEQSFYNLYNVKYFQLPSTLVKIDYSGACINSSRYIQIYVPKSVVEILHRTSNSGIFGSNSRLEVYCEAESQPSTWPTIYPWDYVSSTQRYVTHWGYQRVLKDGLVYYIKGSEKILIDVYDTNIEDCIIDEDTTSIGKYAFEDCINLKHVKIPENITELSDYMFYNATSLESVELPSHLTKIGTGAFIRCNSLKSIVIPKTVTEIGGYAFGSCKSLKSIYIPKSVDTIGKRICYYTDNIIIYCESAAKKDNWNDLYNCGNDSTTNPLYYEVKFNYTYNDYLKETGASA